MCFITDLGPSSAPLVTQLPHYRYFGHRADDMQSTMKLLAGLMLLARVEEMSATVVHAPDIKLPGWKAAITGKCRGGTANVVDVAIEVNGKSCSTCGVDATHMTQRECASACSAENTCIGYQHGHDGSCTVFGPGIDVSPDSEDGKPWTAETKTEKNTIAGADSDAQYICVLPCGGADQDPCPLPGNRYTEVGKGGCRGNGGTNDLVNSRSVKDSSQVACEAECDADPNCVGYAVSTDAVSGMWCIIYGPTQAGTCTTDAAKTTEAACGTCTMDGAKTALDCTGAGGTWTSGWDAYDTSSLPWESDSHATTHIHSSAATQGDQPAPPPPPPASSPAAAAAAAAATARARPPARRLHVLRHRHRRPRRAVPRLGL